MRRLSPLVAAGVAVVVWAGPGRVGVQAGINAGLPVSGECQLTGTLGFPGGIHNVPQGVPVNLAASGPCAGALVPSGNSVNIAFGTQSLTASCAGFAGVLVGTIGFAPQSQDGFSGETEIAGDLASFTVTTVDTTNTDAGNFTGQMQFAVVGPINAAELCTQGALQSVQLQGAMEFGTS